MGNNDTRNIILKFIKEQYEKDNVIDEFNNDEAFYLEESYVIELLERLYIDLKQEKLS